MTINHTTSTVTLPVRGDGTALRNTSESIFGLVDVKTDRGTVTYVPDPDNESRTIFWVRGIQGEGNALPTGEVTLTLEYTEM